MHKLFLCVSIILIVVSLIIVGIAACTIWYLISNNCPWWEYLTLLVPAAAAALWTKAIIKFFTAKDDTLQ